MFTRAQIKEIAALLKAAAVKDAKFTIASALDGTEYVPLLQDAKNRRVLMSEVFDYLNKSITPGTAAALQCIFDVIHTELHDLISFSHDFLLTERVETKDQLYDVRDDILEACERVIGEIRKAQDSIMKMMSHMPDMVSKAVCAAATETITNVLTAKMNEYLEKLEELGELTPLTNPDLDGIFDDGTTEGDDTTDNVTASIVAACGNGAEYSVTLSGDDITFTPNKTTPCDATGEEE